MASKLQLRRGTAAEWTLVNPILADGEPAIESDTNKIKLGNGVTAWTALPYNTTDTSAITTAINNEIARATAAEALLAPQITTYTKTEVDTALSGKASAANNTGVNTGDETTATIKTKLGITTLSGSNTGDQTTITGNAGSATVLATARTINGVSFDGSGNIVINAVDSTARVATSAIGAASGIAPLGSDSKIASTYLPSYVDDVLEYANLASFPTTGESGKIYVALDTNKTYRWGGSSYTYITSGAIDSISVTTPLASTGGATPTISIGAATTSAEGSMSAADKTKLDAVNTSALVKTGGTVGQVLTKIDSTDYNTQWTTPTAGGTIDSVVAPLAYNTTTKVLSTDGTIVINGGTAVVGIGGVSNATSQLTVTDTTLATGGSGTLSGTLLDLNQTWETTANPTAIKLNVTNTASGSTAKLMDLQVGGVSKFSVDKSGVILVPFAAAPIVWNGSAGLGANGDNTTILTNSVTRAVINVGGVTTTSINFGGDLYAPDLSIRRDAANTLAQRNSINPQSFRLYRNFTSVSDLAYSDSKQDATTGLIVNAVNTGTNAEPTKLVDYQLNGVSKFTVDKNGDYVVGGARAILYCQSNGTNYGDTKWCWGLDEVSATTRIFGISKGALGLNSGIALAWSNGSNPNVGQGNVQDLFLYRDAANTLAQRNGTNSQTSRIYNTYTTASDWERLSLGFATYSGAIYAKLAVEGGGTSAAANIGIALSPKGTGAITAQVPDGTTAGGNARGANSVDLQTVRGAASQVVTSAYSTIAGGSSNTISASSDYSSILGGYVNTASAYYSAVLGGFSNTTSAAFATSSGAYGVANKRHQVAVGLSRISLPGDTQHSTLGFVGATTNATTTEIFLGNASPDRATIPNSTTWAADIDIVARSTSGTENAYFKRRLVIQKGTTAASTSIAVGPDIVGTDMKSSGAADWGVTLSADTTNGAMKLEVTGSAMNVRWVAKVSLVEVGYA